jgi:hypothetical protein
MEFKDLDLTKEYTYADYLNWTFQETVELIKGRVFDDLSIPVEEIFEGLIDFKN